MSPRTQIAVGPRPSIARRVISGLVVMAGVIGVTLIAITPLDLEAQIIFGAGMFAVAILLNRFAGPRVTMTITVIAGTMSTRYLFWRLTRTMPMELSLDLVLGALLLGAELFAFVLQIVGYVQTAGPIRRKPVPLPTDRSQWPTVDVFIPTYNEPLEVVRATVLAARQMDWPAEKLAVYILDDGRRDSFRAFAEEAGVGYLTRKNNEHAKAGNLNEALKRTRGDFVAVFDCDHVPTRSFLQMTMGFLVANNRVAFVQTPHHFYSPDPYERNLGVFKRVPNEGELFYGLLQPGNDLWNAAFFCGSCAVLRRRALDDVGGVAVETVTEDAHTALKMHRRGWTSVFLDVPLAAGLATESVSGQVGQRIRWARGMAQIFRIDNPLLGRGLSLTQRLCYLNATLYFFSGIPRLIFLTSPLAFLLFEARIFNAVPAVILSYALPFLFLNILANSRRYGRYRYSWWGEIYETLLAFYIMIPTTVALISPRTGRFNVTPKGGVIERGYFDFRIMWPILAVFVVNMVGVGLGVWRLVADVGRLDATVINLGWTAYNLVIVCGAIAVGAERRQRRSQPRIERQLPAMIRTAANRTLSCETLDLSLTGALVRIQSDQSTVEEEEITLSVFVEGREIPLPAQVVEYSGRTARVRFDDLSVEELSGLVRLTLAPADAWTRWQPDRPADHPLRAWLSIAAHGLLGMGRMMASTVRMRSGRARAG